MKIFSTLVLFVFFAFGADAQGNMQFNQVIRSKFTSSTNTSGGIVTAGTITVPDNKVWKIESGSIVSTGSFYPEGAVELFVDTQLLFSWLVEDMNSTKEIAPFVFNSAPIWLPSGNYPITYRQQANAISIPFGIAISALEFNIVP